MERQLWKKIVDAITNACKPIKCPGCTFDCVSIVKTWLWAVVHDRSVSWACNQDNWPPYYRRNPIPSDSTISRRLGTHEVLDLLRQVEELVLRPECGTELVWAIDGKPLTISGSSSDRQAGYGRATGGKGKGYKLHLILGNKGSVACWRIAPMNKDERVMAKRMLRHVQIYGYLVADKNYDSNKLHQECEEKGNLQLVTPRRYGPGRGTGNRKQTSGRLRSMAILEDPDARFGYGLLKLREKIERYFGNLTSWGGGLTHLPPWVRGMHRVTRWVQGKLIINGFKRSDA